MHNSRGGSKRGPPSANEIACWFRAGPDEAWGSYWLREIEIPPIKDECSYATALHEAGHILGRHQAK